jgi:hypothetical protein
MIGGKGHGFLLGLSRPMLAWNRVKSMLITLSAFGLASLTIGNTAWPDTQLLKTDSSEQDGAPNESVAAGSSGESAATDTSAAPPSPSASVLAAQQARIEAMKRASLATVAVHSKDGEGGGSGVCISSDGYVLTNFHVSSPFGHRMKCGLNDGKMYDCVVAGIDPTGDLAVLKMYGRDDFPVAAIGDSDLVRAVIGVSQLATLLCWPPICNPLLPTELSAEFVGINTQVGHFWNIATVFKRMPPSILGIRVVLSSTWMVS